jgi:Flp pilus assembly protein TadG
MFRRFWKDIRGNYMLLTAISMVPIMGALAISIDYTELTRQCAATRNALDAAGIATARRIAEGANETDVRAYAHDFFESNLAGVDPSNAELTILMPNNNYGGGTLKLSANVTYHPKFLPTAAMLINKTSSTPNVNCSSESEIRLKNTLEVALVLDNSGSMKEYGTGTSKKRIDLLKEASTELVEKLALQASQMKQVTKPVQFALVPFSASVNIAPSVDDKPWLDTTGISPIHHENFDWSQMTEDKPNLLGDRFAKKVGDVWYKKGAGWGATEGRELTRFSLYSDMIAETGREEVPGSRHRVCVRKDWRGNCDRYEWQYDYTYTTSQYTSWQGCVEARPYPYNVDDTTPTSSIPATLYVPMFAPDEAGNLWRDLDRDGSDDLTADNDDFDYDNSWWADWEKDNTGVLNRQKDARKYFRVKPYGSSSAGSGKGPNFSCTTEPITPLQDVTTTDGKETIVDAIDDMKPTGNTNVPEGTAWGWRVLSSNEPFTEGRGNTEKGNDKVVIVLTDGANTYGDQGGDDDADNKSTYAAYGYAGHKFASTETTTRLYKGTSDDVSKTTYTASNYQKALDEQMRAICANAKGSNILVMTVALDLNKDKTDEAKAISELKSCASDSRFRKDDDGNPKKLFWNATGATLSTVFKEIADELSNLRIVG